MKLIDADMLDKLYPNYSVLPRSCIERAEIIDARPARYAEWEFVGADEWGKVYSCSFCGSVVSCEIFETPIEAERLFCSRCGSIMHMKKGENIKDAE